MCTATTTREVKAAQSSVNLCWFGLFFELLGRFPTGSSLSGTRSHDLPVLTTPYHFVPHLSRKLLIVNRKVKGWTNTLVPPAQTTRTCGEPEMGPQAVGFTLRIRSLFIRFDFSGSPRCGRSFVWKMPISRRC